MRFKEEVEHAFRQEAAYAWRLLCLCVCLCALPLLEALAGDTAAPLPTPTRCPRGTSDTSESGAGGRPPGAVYPPNEPGGHALP